MAGGDGVVDGVSQGTPLDERLRELARLFDGAPVVLYAKGTDGRFLAANRRFLQLIGLPLERLVGLTSRDVMPPAVAEEDERADIKALAGSFGAQVLLLWPRGADRIQEIEGHKVPVVAADGRPTATLAIAWDVTSRREFELVLSETESRFRTFFQGCPVPLLEIDVTGFARHARKVALAAGTDVSTVLTTSPAEYDEAVGQLSVAAFNRALLEFLGAATIQEVDHATRSNVLLHARAAFINLLAKVCDGARSASAEMRIKDLHGMWRFVSLRLSVVPGASGDVLRGIVCISDLTEVRGNEQRLVDESRRSQLYLDLLVHDVRNLTQGVIAAMYLISISPDIGAYLKPHVERAITQAEWINELVTKVTALSKVDASDCQDRPRDLARAVWKAVEHVCSAHKEREIVVNFVPPRAKAHVLANDLLVEAIVNLLDNAVRFDSHDRVRIDIDLRPVGDGQRWRLSVKDNTPGVPVEAKRSMFERFDRGDAFSPGSVPGMAMVDGIVRRMGGSVWVEDKVPGDPSAGSCYVVELPAAK